jgi:adenylate cyclase
VTAVFSPRKGLVAIAIAGAAGLVAFGAGRIPFVERVENASYDWRVAETGEPVSTATPIVFVDISESTVRALEPIAGRWPWPRAVHAAAIDYIAASGAKTIVVDILFGEREGPGQAVVAGQAITGQESDQTLVDAVRRADNVILLGEATSEGAARQTEGVDAPIELPGPLWAPGGGFVTRPSLQMPFSDLRVSARGLGHNYLERGAGGDLARRMLPFIDVQGVAVPSLGIAGVAAFLDLSADDVRVDGDGIRIGTVHMPTVAGAGHQVLVPFRRPTEDADGVRSTFPSYSFYDVLLSADQQATGKPPAVPPSAFQGKLVFIGTSAAGTFDRYQTPFTGGVAGVELHAMLAEAVLSGRVMKRASPIADGLVSLGATSVAAAASVFLPVWWATAIVAGAVLGLGWWLTSMVGDGVWVAAVQPGIAAAVALFGGVAWQYFVEGRQKREIKRLFGRYVSKDVIEQLIADPALATLGGQRREMTVLFSDIRGFTTAAEQGAPEAVVAQLNEYFSEMVDVLFKHRGTLDKFVGDMVMGLFGAPIEDPAHADHAVLAAIEMVEALERLNVRWRAEGRPALDIGIGINTGEMIAGNVGAEAIMSYTVIGDAVNLGARLESLNKDYGTRILVSEATRAKLTAAVATRPIGSVTVKGKTQPVVVHEVTGRST